MTTMMMTMMMTAMRTVCYCISLDYRLPAHVNVCISHPAAADCPPLSVDDSDEEEDSDEDEDDLERGNNGNAKK